MTGRAGSYGSIHRRYVARVSRVNLNPIELFATRNCPRLVGGGGGSFEQNPDSGDLDLAGRRLSDVMPPPAPPLLGRFGRHFIDGL
jgi:hypothetical protein